MSTYGAITVLGVHCLTSPVTITASVVNTTETTLDSKALPTDILRPNSLYGRNLNIRAKGLLTTSLVPVTINVKMKYGSTVLCSTGAFTPVVSLTNTPWQLEIDVSSVSSGTVEAQGLFRYADTVTTLNTQNMSNTGTVAATITGAITPAITITYGGNTAGNSITIRTDIWEIGGLI